MAMDDPSPVSKVPPPSSTMDALDQPVVLHGIAGSPGVAVGPALVVGEMRAVYTRRHVHTAQIEGEVRRFEQAVGVAQAALKQVAAPAPASPAAAILDAYLAMLGDPLLHEEIVARIRTEKKCAEWAVAAAAEAVSAAMGSAAADDPYIAERRHDVEFVADRILRALMGESPMAIPRLVQPCVIVARDLSPADTAAMVREPALGFVTEIGSRTSHTSIMARALEIPAVVGTARALETIRTGDTIIVDGLRGEITVHPTEEQIADAQARSARHLEFARGLLRHARQEEGHTACGTKVAVKANVELPAEAILAVDHGAEGVGLYRTEFLYIDRAELPTEEEQYEVYRAIVETIQPRPVTLRTFDLGGDKFASSFPLPAEMNPALGLRAVRLALSQPEVLKTQLRAMVRASAHGDVRIMVPMVTAVEEMREVARLLAEATADVATRGLPHAAKIPLGMMIEVPSAAVMADVFARFADFFSLGTNDLVQYALAVDRTSQSLARLASPLHPSILRLVDAVVRAGGAASIPVSICGAMASEPLAIPLLIGLGLRELSMEAGAIPEAKEVIRRVTVEECREVAARALAAESAEAVEDVVMGRFAERLGDLLSGTMDRP
jgi:phosphotransferase system enzyme I (PtsI)